MKRNHLLMTFSLLLMILACKKNNGADDSTGPKEDTTVFTAGVTIDCNVLQGVIRNSLYSRANITFTGGTASSGAPLKTVDNDFLIGKGISKEAARLFISTNTVKSNGINNYDAYVQDASRVPKELLVVLSGYITGNGTDTVEFRSLVRQVLEHYKALAPNLVYIEAGNEYDLLTSPQTDDITYYNKYYRVIYEEVNRLNSRLPATVKPLKVGGPCISQWNPVKMENFIKNYRADAESSKRLDFISYHEYCSWNTSGVTNTDHLIHLGTRRSTIEGWLEANGLSTDLPVFVTEHGIFPGNKLRAPGSPYNEAPGMLMAAASAATYNYYYVTTGNNKLLPFLWDTRFNEYPEKSILADNSKYAINVPTTFGNTIIALSMMDSVRIKSSSQPVDTNTGLGVYALATMSTGKINVLIWNWQHQNVKTHTADVSLTNLPASFSGKRITMSRRVIDGQNSNFLYNPLKANLQIVETVYDFNPSHYTLSLSPNEVVLLTLSISE